MVCHLPCANCSYVMPAGVCDSKTLCLHFDVNKTLIAFDTKGEQNFEDVVNILLSEKYHYCWTRDISQPISFYEYVQKHLSFTETPSLSIEKQQRACCAAFINSLKVAKHPLCEQVEKEYRALQARLNHERDVFPSFFKLLHHLQERQQHYHLILRTFGQDLQKVVANIENKMPQEQFKSYCHFEYKTLQVDKNSTLQKTADIYAFFKNSGHVAIQDSWREWNMGHRQSICGKYFLYNSEDKSALSLFFDDNIQAIPGSLFDIVHPVDLASEKQASVYELAQKKLIFKVDTLRALAEDNYFIELVESALD